MVVIKILYQLLQTENLAVVCRTPSQKRYIIYNCLRQKSLLDQILIGRVTASLAELLVLLIGDQRTMDILWLLPSKCLIKSGIFRCRGKILVTTYYMCNFHQMIVNNIGKIVSWISV